MPSRCGVDSLDMFTVSYRPALYTVSFSSIPLPYFSLFFLPFTHCVLITLFLDLSLTLKM